jgi:YegS/Rv2252/BmrU family lipid kinase
MPDYLFIVNPVSGRGTGHKSIPILKSILGTLDFNYDLVVTQRPWHASELALQAAQDKYQAVVAVGGDGTSNEVLNGLVKARQAGMLPPAMGVLCVGRGNDFAYGMQIPHNLEAGIQILKENFRKKFDIGLVEGGLFPQGRYFGNGVGIGFDAVVGFEALKLAPLSGFVSYIVAAIKTIFLYFDAPRVKIELDNEILIQPALMVSIMNGRRMGGGFMMAPEALTGDGAFDVCIAGQVSRMGIFTLIPRFMKGTQNGHPAIRFARSAKVTVTAVEGKLPAHSDGETLCKAGEKLSLKIIPQALDIICHPQ